MTASRNRHLSRIAQDPSFQISFDGNDIVLNYDVKSPDFDLASTAGITVDRSSAALSPARFYWDESSLSWKTTEDLDISRLNIKATDQIDLTFEDTDPIVIGLRTGQNLAMDNNTIQSRNNNGSSSLELNIFGGSVTVGSRDLSAQLNLRANEVNNNAKNTVNITTALLNSSEVINMVTGGNINSTSAVHNLTANTLTINATTTINGLPIVNVYRQSTFPSTGTNPNLTNNDILYKTDESKVYVYNSGTASWVDVLDPGTY